MRTVQKHVYTPYVRFYLHEKKASDEIFCLPRNYLLNNRHFCSFAFSLLYPFHRFHIRSTRSNKKAFQILNHLDQKLHRKSPVIFFLYI